MNSLHEIYQQYAPQVYRFAWGLCGDPDWADDLTSEAFVRAFTSPAPIRQATVKAYLFTIVRNLYRRAWRTDDRLTDLADQVLDQGAGPESLAEQSDSLRRLVGALQKLPEIDRAAVLMRAQDELSYEEIAAALGLSLAAVKVKIHRARLKLAGFVKE